MGFPNDEWLKVTHKLASKGISPVDMGSTGAAPEIWLEHWTIECAWCGRYWNIEALEGEGVYLLATCIHCGGRASYQRSSSKGGILYTPILNHGDE